MSSPSEVLVPTGGEFIGGADYHDGFAVFLDYQQGTNVNDLFYWDRWNPGVVHNLSQNHGEHLEPSIFNGIAAWRLDTEVFMTDIITPSGPPQPIANGSQPAVGSSVIAMEDNGDLLIYDLSTASSDWYPSSHGPLSWPSVGGNVVAYNTANDDIAFQRLDALGSEELVEGICGSHFDPRVNRLGTIILHAGSGCPSGSDGLYVTYLRSDGSQELYRIDSLPGSKPYRSRDRYSIDVTAVGYVDGSSVIRYVDLAP